MPSPNRSPVRYKNMRIHMIGDEEGMRALGVASKANLDGRAAAERWLAATSADIGVRSSIDIRQTFL